MNQTRIVVTVLGTDRSGIVAAVATKLSECSANIVDISQTILDGIFTMTMLVDLDESLVPFDTLREAVTPLHESLGVQIQVQREDVFRFMHRI